MSGHGHPLIRLLNTCALLTYQFGPSSSQFIEIMTRSLLFAYFLHSYSSFNVDWVMVELLTSQRITTTSFLRLCYPVHFTVGFTESIFTILFDDGRHPSLYSHVNHHLNRSSYRHRHLRMRGTAIRLRISYSPS